MRNAQSSIYDQVNGPSEFDNVGFWFHVECSGSEISLMEILAFYHLRLEASTGAFTYLVISWTRPSIRYIGNVPTYSHIISTGVLATVR